MKNELTPLFASKVLKVGRSHKATYCIKFLNIEVENIATKEVRFINIHEFIHTHCRDFLLSYSNGLVIHTKTERSEVDVRISVLSFSICLTVPNLLDCSPDSEHIETFIGLSELSLFIDAVEWLINYRESNPKLSKFWVNKF